MVRIFYVFSGGECNIWLIFFGKDGEFSIFRYCKIIGNGNKKSGIWLLEM